MTYNEITVKKTYSLVKLLQNKLTSKKRITPVNLIKKTITFSNVIG